MGKVPSSCVWQSIKRWIPLIVIVLLVASIYLFGINKYLTFDNLKHYHKVLDSLTKEHPLLSVLVYLCVYFLGTSLSFPQMSLITLAGGFLFIFPLSALYTIIPATLGASVIFLIGKTSIGHLLTERAEKYTKKMQEGFQKNATNYLLFLRLVPLFPFWLINIAPSIFNVRLSTFFWTTLVGITPGTVIYCYAGNSLRSIFENNEVFSIDAFFTKEIIIAFCLMAALILVPVIIKLIRKKRSS